MNQNTVLALTAYISTVRETSNIKFQAVSYKIKSGKSI